MSKKCHGLRAGSVVGLLLGFASWVYSAGYEPYSIFFVDGHAVDALERKETNSDAFFHGSLPPLNLKERPDLIPKKNPWELVSQDRQGVPGYRQAIRHVRSASIYARSGQWERALSELQEAQKHDPRNEEIQRQLGAMAALSKNYGLADSYFQLYLDQRPDDYRHLAGWASVLIRLRRFDEAEAISRRVLALSEDDMTSRFNLACVSIALEGETAIEDVWSDLTLEEVAMVANWLKADAEDLVHALGADAYQTLCARLLFEGAHEQLDEIIRALRATGIAQQSGSWSTAIKELSHVMRLGVRGPKLEARLAQYLFESGERESALRLFRSVCSRSPDNPATWFNYGYAALKLGEAQQAQEAFQAARDLAPDRGQVAFALACAYAEAGQLDAAWPLLRELAARDGQQLPTWMEGDESYLRAIRSDPRYEALMQSIVR